MSPQSLSVTLFPQADASATQPRSKIRSPFSPLVGWIAALWSPEGRKKMKKDRFLLPEPVHFTSPVDLTESPAIPPIIHPTDSTGMVSRAADDDDTSEMSITSCQPGLSKEEHEYVVNSLLAFLEEGKVPSAEQVLEEYEYYAPEGEPRLRHGLWSPASSMYALYDGGGGDDRSEAETLEMDGAYDRASLELARTACNVPELCDDDDGYPCYYEFGFEGEYGESE